MDQLMPILAPALREAAERPHGTSPWVLLWDVEIVQRTKTLPPIVFRFTGHHQAITWPVVLPGASETTDVTFHPFPFSMSDIEQDNEGNLPAIDLAIDNIGRLLMSHVHNGDGFEGNRAQLYITHTDALLLRPAQHVPFRFRVASAIAADESITMRLEPTNLNDVRVPQNRFIQGTCQWQFGGPECGYAITPTAAFTTCGKRIPDCSARGDDEVARGLPRLHPKRFRGFPGIATQRS